MRITTIDEARALVGRTFERDGKAWTVHKFQIGQRARVYLRSEFSYWNSSLEEFNDFLSGATEIVTQ